MGDSVSNEKFPRERPLEDVLFIPETVIALRCHVCGKIGYHHVSMFSLGKSQSVSLRCRCGQEKASLGHKSKQGCWLRVTCPLCEETHVYTFTTRDFFSRDIKALSCLETELEIGYMGEENAVKQAAEWPKDELDAKVAEASFEEYFDDPQVMYETLLSCPCGNTKLEVNIYKDRLELKCPTCGKRQKLPASSPEDLASFESLGSFLAMHKERRSDSDKTDSPKPRSKKKSSRSKNRDGN
jgi:hypothetical protein